MGLNLYLGFESLAHRQEHVVEKIYSARAARCGSRLLICAKASLVRFQIAEPNTKEENMSVKKDSKRDPMKSKTGKPHLGPLNIEQLTKMLETCRPKHKNKIQRAIASRTK